MLPGTPRVIKWLHVHRAAKRLPQSVLSNILTKSLHTEAITGCNTIFYWYRQEYMLVNVY